MAADIFYTEYGPVGGTGAQAGDYMIVRNVENRIGLNHIYRMDEDGLWAQVPNPFQGRSGIVEYVQKLAAAE